MNSQISQISEIIEDIKETITDNQYKIVTWRDNIMKIHSNNNNNKTFETRRVPTIGRRTTEEEHIEALKLLSYKYSYYISKNILNIISIETQIFNMFFLFEFLLII